MAATASVPPLSGKLSPPPLGFAPFLRPRLFQLLSNGVRTTPVTLLSGPAGAGKTVLAGTWLRTHRDDGCVAWLSLEEADDDPAVFWAYLLAALRRAGLELPRSISPGPAEASSGALALRLAAHLLALPRSVTLILDDADSLTRRDLTGALDLLVRYAGARLRLVLCARTAPLLPLHRYRVAGTLTEIRTDRLAFTTEETHALLAELGTPVSAEVAAALREATEGWAVALRLAAARLRRGTAPEQLLAAIADDDSVAHYLSAEVLERQTAAARRVLQRVSVSDELALDLIDQLTGQPAARRVLSSLAQANAFVEPAAGAPGGYRIHPLVREILQMQLAYEAPEEFAALHRTCAAWYAQAGRRPKAARHALAAGDGQLAARLLIDDLDVARMLAHGISSGSRTPTVPAATAGPDAAVIRAAGRLSAGSAAEPADLTVAESAAADSAARRALRASAAVVCAAAEAVQPPSDDLLRAAQSAPTLAAALLEEQPRRRAELAAVLADARADALLRTDAPDDVLLDALRTALAASRAASADRLVGRCQAWLALLEALHGRLRTAAQLIADAEARADARNLPESERSAGVATAAAWVAAERGEHAQSRRWIAWAQQRAAAPDAALTGPLLAVLASRQLRTRSEADAAEQALQPARDGAAQPRWVRIPVTVERLRICLARREKPADLRLLDGLDAAHAALLRATAAALRLPGAPPPPAQLDVEQPPSVAVPLGVVYACLHTAAGDTPAAVSAAERALRLAEPELLRGPFLDAPPALRPLLRGHPRLAAAAVWLNPAAPALSVPRRPPRADHRSPPAPVAAGPLVCPQLSEREREVLQHLAGMLSTTEIAAAMFVSVNTVRTHIRHILCKLAATRRGEAVRRARELQLL